ncbi:MAG: sensor histidine kinase, partial [Candidatus Methylomirabilales bacterium]
ESGRLVTRISPVDLPQVVKEVIPAFERRGGPELRTDLDQELPLLLADRDMLVQILTNLVSNAVKYSAPATPVSITAHANESYIVVAVEDQGIGMTEEEALRVFDKFARVDRPEVRRAGGTGLGLYITKSLVEMQGGQIWVRSEPGRGSSFFFCLPSAPAAPSRDEHPSDAKEGAS